jgi:outer membrane biosynthesis protein TonB
MSRPGERLSRPRDRWVSIALSVLLHGALLAALVYGWLLFRQPPRPPPTLAIEGRVVDARAVPGTPAPPPPQPPPPATAPQTPPEDVGPPQPTPEELAQREQERHQAEQAAAQARQAAAEQAAQEKAAQEKAAADKAAKEVAERKAAEARAAAERQAGGNRRSSRSQAFAGCRASQRGALRSRARQLAVADLGEDQEQLVSSAHRAVRNRMYALRDPGTRRRSDAGQDRGL